MGNQFTGGWYLTKPEAISRFLVSVIRNWNYPVFWNRSEDSESVYIHVCLGTRETPQWFRIRISEHSVPPKNVWITFNMDVYSGFEREGAISYIKLLSKLAEDLAKPFPAALEQIKIGTEAYKKYRVEMQRRGKVANARYRFSGQDRFYV